MKYCVLDFYKLNYDTNFNDIFVWLGDTLIYKLEFKGFKAGSVGGGRGSHRCKRNIVPFTEY